MTPLLTRPTSKSDVNGPDTCEVFKYLKNESHTWGQYPEEPGHRLPQSADLLVLIAGRSIKWNFVRSSVMRMMGDWENSDLPLPSPQTKFLVDRRGNVVGRYAPWTKPEDIESTIVRLLNE